MLEHHISEKFEQRIAEKLGHPTHDPHGDPIPDVNLQFPKGPSVHSISELKPGQSGRIRRVRTQDSDALNLLTKLELTIDNQVEVLEKTRDGVRVMLNGDRLLVPVSLARQVMVEISA